MKILDIIKTHYCDEFWLKFKQDDEFTIIDVSEGEYSQCKTFVFPNDAAKELASFLNRKDIDKFVNTTVVFQKAKFKFVESGRRWAVNTEYNVKVQNNEIHV